MPLWPQRVTIIKQSRVNNCSKLQIFSPLFNNKKRSLNEPFEIIGEPTDFLYKGSIVLEIEHGPFVLLGCECWWEEGHEGGNVLFG